MNELLTSLLELVQSVDPLVRTLVAGAAMVLETSVLVGLFVPGDTIVLVAGTAVSSFADGVGLAAAVVVGSLVGESIGFWLGRALGPRIRRSWAGRRMGEERWARAERYLQRRGGVAVFISRFLPVVHALVPLTVGMSPGFRYRRFLAWAAPACIVWASLYVSVAAMAAGTYRELAETLHHAAYLFVGIMVVFVVLVAVAAKVIERVERRHLVADEAPAQAPGRDTDLTATMGD